MSKMTEVLTPAEAGAVLEEIESRKAQLSAALAEIGLKLEKAETDLGEAVLSGDEDAVRNVADLRLRCDGLNAALTALEKRRGVALISRRRAEAEDLRRRAEAKRVELGALEAKTGKLLKGLSILEGILYDGSILLAMRVGTWYTSQGGLNKPGPCHGPLESFADPATNWEQPYGIPLSRRLSTEIADLERQVAAIEDELGGSKPAMAEQAPAEATASQETPIDTYVHPGRFRSEGEELPGGDAR